MFTEKYLLPKAFSENYLPNDFHCYWKWGQIFTNWATFVAINPGNVYYKPG